MIRPPHRITSLPLAIACAVLAASCGGSSDGADTDSTSASASVETTTGEMLADSTTVPETGSVATGAPPPADTTPAEPGSGTAGAQGAETWDGSDFAALADARMDELAAVFGQPATSASLAPTFALPDDFPYPAGTVVGTFQVFERILWKTGAIDIREERIVGASVDGVADAALLDALAASIEADGATRWERSSSQRESFLNDLYTALPLDGGDVEDRLLMNAITAPEVGQPPLTFKYELTPTEILVPNWQAGLPILEGGEVDVMREGRGVVEDFGQLAEDGYIELRVLYPLDRYDDLEAFFSSGVIAAAGFQYEDTPLSNLDIRIDVSNGAWEGTVGVGTVSSNNEDTGYQLIWVLTRPVG